jgi:hypothetical protein
MAAELELDTVTDLLQQILEWETATGKSLSTVSISEFNKIGSGYLFEKGFREKAK